MAVTPTYPGVYLSEEASLNFSVTSSATAIPAFVFYPRSTENAPSDKIVRLNNWSDFFSLIGQDDSPAHYFDSMKAWFMNGGGPCYMVNRKNIVEEVPKYNDITLLVEAGAVLASQVTEKKEIYDSFVTLVQQGSSVFGLFDGTQSKIESDSSVEDIMDIYPATSRAAVFYPWGKVAWSAAPVPASVIAAITIAKTDRTRGVWKAPANIAISGITPNFPVSDDLQGRFNRGKALNMIRTFPDVGTVIWGTRTLEDSDNWRYIPVRRLFSMVERDIQKALNKLVFEPNSQPTWQRVKAAIDNYLYRLWQQGALAGNKASEAWFVDIGKDITMTEDDINQGRLIVKIGLAAVRPAEFILLQFSQDIAQ